MVILIVNVLMNGASKIGVYYCAVYIIKDNKSNPHFRTTVSALTSSLPVSSSFRVTHFRTTHYPPLSEWIATQVNSRINLSS